MNIKKTNPLGLCIAENGFVGKNQKINDIIYGKNIINEPTISLNVNLLRHNPNQKVIRVSKNVIETCKLIDYSSINENIIEANFNFRSLFIILPDDNMGVIKIERFGSELSFLMIYDLWSDKLQASYNSYSFLSKCFSNDIEYQKNNCFIDKKSSEFVIQLLTYLIYGEITEKYLPSKSKSNVGFTRFLNPSKLNITFCDTLWKQRINTDGFKVSGHFRLQPIGEKKINRKLIWIEEFQKKGYNRRATVELIKN